jgi:hypothetical protein
MFEMAKQIATSEDAKEKQTQHWIRTMGYIDR